MRVLGMPLPFYKSATLLLGFGLSPYVLARLWKIRPDVIHVAFPGADGAHPVGIHWGMPKYSALMHLGGAAGAGVTGAECRYGKTACGQQPC